MAQHAAALARIGTLLGPDAEILLWACETGRGAQGARFLAALSAETGADIAAATRRVGGAAHGGTWELDVSTGPIAADNPFDARVLVDFDGVLLNVVNARPPSIYFSAIAPGSSGADLYRLGADGSFEAIPVRTDAGAASGSRAGANGGYMVFNDRLYFFADTDAGPAGLFSLGPDGSVTPVSGIRAAPDGVNAHFTIFDKLYFVADGPQGVNV
jgi:hypothetical protein